ncbi:MAG: DUF2796 domain-containing protein [Betaproteobacteria bacterium]|nr:DUF2796 domain-containing protein [Betaproteobacteria bacterium]
MIGLMTPCHPIVNRPHRAGRSAAGPRTQAAARIRHGLLIAFLTLAPAAPAASAPGGHGHVHGQARLDLTLEGARLTIEAELPMETLTGFERAPRNDDERARLQRALDALRATGVFRPTPEAGCRPASQVLRWSGSAETATAASGLPGDDTHLDLLVTHAFDCERPARLGMIEIGLFDVLSRLRRIEARFAGPGGTQARTLQRNRKVFELAR